MQILQIRLAGRILPPPSRYLSPCGWVILVFSAGLVACGHGLRVAEASVRGVERDV